MEKPLHEITVQRRPPSGRCSIRRRRTMGVKEIALSSGSACTSATLEPSYVLRALGVGSDLAHSSIRFGLGRFNTDEEVDYTAKRMVEAVTRLREMSPLYEMAKEGIDLSKVSWVTD